MVRCVAYGSENDGKFYVQTCCGEEHIGNDCDCNILGEDLSEVEAKELARQRAEQLNVPLEVW